MNREWPAYQVLGAFFALVVSALVALRLVISWAKKRVVLRHVVIDAWIPVVHELVRRGVTAPEVLAALLAGYDLTIERPVAVAARLPAAVASVSDALQVNLQEITRAIVARAHDEAGAATLIAELRALRTVMDGLPGVTAVGPLWPDDARTLARLVAHYAGMVAVPIPGRTDR